MSPKSMWAAVWSVAACTFGCASTDGNIPPPNDAWAAARADVGRAEAGGAPAIPEARLHLQLAEEDLEQARRIMGADNARATSLSLVAGTEAQLAFSLTKKAYAEEQARKAQTELQAPSIK